MGRRIAKFDTSAETPENQQKLAMGGKKKFTIHDLKKYYPKTEAQEEFWDAYANDLSVILQVGPAGTGKTAIALWNMMYEVLSGDFKYRKIIIIRPPTATQDLGFMPGTEAEKEAYYLEPYRRVIDEMFNYATSWDNLIALGIIEFRTSANLRGLTFDDWSLVLVDEFQGADIHQLKTIFTRLGENSKIVFCGDFGQNDLRHKRGSQVSGYHDFVKIIERMKEKSGTEVQIVEYKPSDVVRSGIVRDFIISCYELNI